MTRSPDYYEDLDLRSLGHALPYFGAPSSSLNEFRGNVDVEKLGEDLSIAMYSLGSGEVTDPEPTYLNGDATAFLEHANNSLFGTSVGLKILLAGQGSVASSDLNVGPTVTGADWHFFHRMVDPGFRGNGFGSVIVKAMDSFVQGKADSSQKGMKTSLDVCQLDAFGIFLKNGYVPATEEDEELFERIVTGDNVGLVSALAGKAQGKEKGFKVKNNPFFRDFVCVDLFNGRQMDVNLEKGFGPLENTETLSLQERFKSQVSPYLKF